MKRMIPGFGRGCALALALLGVGACDLSQEELDAVDDEDAIDVDLEMEGLDEESADPELAAEIARQKLALFETDSISPQHHAPCGTRPPDDDSKITADAASPNAANQRTGSSTGCTILGVLQPSDDADYFCFTLANDNFSWTYLRNVRTGVRGWVRDDLLRDRGSFVHCNF